MKSIKSISSRVARDIVVELSKVLRGHEEKVRVFVAAQTLGLPTLLLGSHGTGKTRLVKSFAKMLYKDGAPIKAFMMLLKSTHKPLDVFYSYDLPALMRGEEKVIPKAIDADLVFLDEVFANELILSALKDFLEERIYDRYEAKWMFFIGATNPGNDFYQNVLIQRNMADLDRFDVIIPMTPPASTVVPEVLEMFDEARTRENDYEPDLKVDVSEISKVREEILTAVKMSQGAKAYLWLMSMAFSTCYYHDEVTGNKSRADRFNMFERLPCERCTFKKFTMCNYALSPMRFARSTTFLAKALAWIEDSKIAGVAHVRTAVKYTLPLRLVATREEVKLSAPTVETFVEQAVKSFESYALSTIPNLKAMLRKVLELDDWVPMPTTDEPLVRVLQEDFNSVLGKMRSTVKSIAESLVDEEALEALSTLQNADIASRARKRLEEIRGVLVIVQPKELKMLLNVLLKKDYITEDELAEFAWKLNIEHGFELNRKGLVVEKVAPRGVRVKGEKAVVEEIKKALEEMRKKVEAKAEAEKAEKTSSS
jgi:MoxR-like ATPase